MAKKSALDRAIEQLESERAVLDAAITRLKQQRDVKVAKTNTPSSEG